MAEARTPPDPERLAAFIAEAAGARAARIEDLAPLSGGAIQENWRLDVALDGGFAGPRLALVLRTDAPSSLAISHSRAREFALLKAAFAAGVTVPEPLWLCTDPAVMGRDFYLMRRVGGTAVGRRLVKEPELGGDRERLVERLGRELARIHSVRPPRPDLDFLPLPEVSPALDAVAEYRRLLDGHGLPQPILEYGLRWCEKNAPETAEITLVHQDFRTGNYMVDESGLTGILDWEFCAWGDPLSDLGWFCARCWRFGAGDLEAGGMAGRAPLYRGYAAESGRAVDGAEVAYWEVMAHIRWAVIALLQGDRFRVEGEASMELALTAHVVPEVEWGMLDLIDGLREMRA